MGRTDWDKNIVKYMSPFAKYFFCPEAIRSEIYESSRHWTFERSDTMSIITITTANEIKGNGLILQTALFLKRVMHFNFIWSIAGSVQSFKSFEKLLGIKHEDVNIKLLGMIDAKSVAKELVVSEVYVHPSIIDNSPNSLCEAQLIGCPVVSSYVGGIPSLVKNGETGFFFPYNEPQSLAFLLMNLHNDKDLLEKISREEIEVSRERHNPSLVVNRLLSIYNDIIEKKFN
jgi:glycosyltransferase involved in cell wall biosynthesis